MTRPGPTAVFVTALGLACALLLALPGRTVTTAYVNDVVIFLDGAHRVAWGQVPNVDFHAALGPVNYLLPAAGLVLGGGMGAAMPVGMALLLLAILPAMAHVLGSRLRPVLGLPFAAFLILMLAVPVNLGAEASQLTFAMFYNRIGWAVLALLLVMVVPPVAESRRQLALDAASAAALVVLQCYTKSTYGAVAIAFLLFMLTDRRQWRWAALALAASAAAAVLVEFAWGGSRAYLRDLLDAAKVSGGRGLEAVVRGGLNNLPDVVLFGLAGGLALWATRSVRLAAYLLGCLAAGMLILSQNAHGWGIITLFAAAVASAELAMRTPRPGGRAPPALAAGAPLLLVAMLLPPTVRHAAGLLLHATLAAGGAGEPLPLPAFADVRYTQLWNPRPDAYAYRYVASFGNGARALAALGTPPERIVNLDFANPFSAGLGVAPPRGDSSWLHWNRNVSEATHLPAEDLLGDAEVVMVPKTGINAPPLFDLYRPYLDEHFGPPRESEQWTIFVRDDPAAEMAALPTQVSAAGSGAPWAPASPSRGVPRP